MSSRATTPEDSYAVEDIGCEVPIVSDWSPYLRDIYQLWEAHFEADLKSSDWVHRWKDVSELVTFGEEFARACDVVREAMGRMDVVLDRHADVDQIAEVRGAFVPVWRRYRELRTLGESYESACRLLSQDSDDHIARLWATPEMGKYERVRLWLRYRRARFVTATGHVVEAPKKKLYERYETLMADPQERERLSEESRARYYRRIGKPVPTSKRKYQRKEEST